MNDLKPHFNPFPGLRPFEAHENHLFFGREGQSDELLARLRRHRFLAVVGTSGSGKSSLVRAGMLPALHGGLMSKAGSHWRIAVFRPGNAPIVNMAHALNEAEVFASQRSHAQVEQRFTETTLRRGKMGLIEAVEEARLPEHEKVLLVIDQFEELFRFKQSAGSIEGENEASAFVKLFLTATQRDGLPIYVVLTMRSDYLGDCAQFRDLPEAINDSQYLIPRMTRDQRRQAITGPIAVGGAHITPRLVNRLLNDVGDNPDQLPILQHALMRTWDYWARHHRGNEPIDLPHYETIGTMANALSLHADEAFNELLSPHSRAIAEKLFKALTEKGEDNREIRRPISLAEASALANANEEEVVHVVEAFRKPGRTFLMPPIETPLRANTLIDISHESLIRNWQRLKAWVEEEAKSAQIYRRLAETAMLHQAGQAGLWRDPDLQIALQWQKENRPNEMWAQRYHSEYARALSYLNRSETARDAEIAEKEAIRQRELQQAQALAEEQRKRAEVQALAASRLRRRAVVLAFVGLIAAGAAVLAFSLWGLAQKNAAEAREQALIAQDNAERAEEQRLRAEREAERALEKEREALAEKDRAERERQRAEAQRALAERRRKLADSLRVRADEARDFAERLRNESDSLRTQAERLRDISLARYLAAQAPLEENDTLAVLLAHQAYLFNKDNEGNLDAEVYNALRESLNRPSFHAGGPDTLRGHTDWGRAVAFGPKGLVLASGSADSTIKLWRLENEQLQLTSLRGHKASVRTLAFSPDGQWLASGGDDHTVRLWNLERLEAPPRVFNGHTDWVWVVAFSPDSRMLASGSLDQTVRLWSLSNQNAPLVLRGHTASVRALAFNANGHLLASGSNDAAALLWDVRNPEAQPRRLQHEHAVRAVAFSPDGDYLATGDEAHRVWRWDLAGGDKPRCEFRGHNGPINAVTFSPNNQVIASGSADGTAKLWNANKPELNELATLAHGYWVWSIAFNQDGTQLATASSDNQIRLWIARLDVLARLARDKAQRELSPEEWEKYIGKQGRDLPYERLRRPRGK